MKRGFLTGLTLSAALLLSLPAIALQGVSKVFGTCAENSTFSAHSPSSRFDDHWTQREQENMYLPAAPDEVRDLEIAELTTIHRIKKVEREKATEVVVAEKEKVVEKSAIWYQAIRKDAPIEIFISGGGFRGGVDPRIHDQIMISNTGLVQHYYETATSGKREEKKQVDREVLFELVQWIAENGFFEFDSEYACPDNDRACWQRMEQRPEPIPLKVVVALGPYRNVVNVPIFSTYSEQEYIDYPVNLRKIVQAIYDFASL